MEQDIPTVPYGERSLVPSSASTMFSNATGFGIRESHFTSVQGNMIVYPTETRQGQVPQMHARRSDRISSRSMLGTTPQMALDHSESANYSNQLLFCGRGFPLYVPAPQIALPEEYRRSGVAIGDVGTVTANGAFDFFFNIYLPGGPPINTNVPDDFVPLPAYALMDVEHHSFDPGNYVSGPTIHEIRGDFSSASAGGEFVFTCRAPNGAVLALPHGAHLKKLRNLERVRRYAAKHAESWYKYANEVRGRGLVNGSLHLVTGWEKTKSWGMASFHDVSLENEFQLAFTPTTDTDSGHRYRWQAPYCHYKHADSPLVDGVPPNQTTFIYAFTISLCEGIWGTLFGGVEISQLADSSTSAGKSGGSIPFVSRSSSLIWSLFGRGGENGGGNQSTGRALETGIISDAAPTQVFHPSQLIHKRILRESPQAKVVITHDDDWCDIFRDNDGMGTTGPNFSELQQAIFDRFALMEVDGVAFLRPSSDKGKEIRNKMIQESSVITASLQSLGTVLPGESLTSSDYTSPGSSTVSPGSSDATTVASSFLLNLWNRAAKFLTVTTSSYPEITPIAKMTRFSAGSRTFSWNGTGQIEYGTVQKVVRAPDGTRILSIKLDSGNSISLPETSVNNASAST